MSKIAASAPRRAASTTSTARTIAVRRPRRRQRPPTSATPSPSRTVAARTSTSRSSPSSSPSQDTAQIGSIVDQQTFDRWSATSRRPSPSSTSPPGAGPDQGRDPEPRRPASRHHGPGGNALGKLIGQRLRLPHQGRHRPAAHERRHRPDRHHQHDVAVDPRTAPRARPAAHHRHDRQPGTPDGPPRVRADLAARHHRGLATRAGRLAAARAVLQPSQRCHRDPERALDRADRHPRPRRAPRRPRRPPPSTQSTKLEVLDAIAAT